MNSPTTKTQVSRKRQRNFLAKKLKEDRAYHGKRIDRRRAEDQDDWKDEIKAYYTEEGDCE